MAIKTHLADSAEPLKEGAKLLAICGAIVPDAAFVFMWDDADMESIQILIPRMTGIVCRKCRDVKLTQKYIYGIRSGEDQKQSLRGHSTE